VLGALIPKRDQQPELPRVDEAPPAAGIRLRHDVVAEERLSGVRVALEGHVKELDTVFIDTSSISRCGEVPVPVDP